MKEWRWRRDEETQESVHRLCAMIKKKKSFADSVLCFIFSWSYEAAQGFLFVFAAWTSTNELHQYCIGTLNLRSSNPHQGERRRISQPCNLDHRSLSWRALKLTLQIFWRSCWCTLGFIGSHIDLCSFPSVELTVFVLCTSWAPST